MILDLERAGKSPRKLRELLKDLPTDPDPETVHQLRTQSRRLEALLHALAPEHARSDRAILELLKPVRRTAGRVRDMDVLIAKAFSLSSRVRAEGFDHLIGRMSAIRNADARRLHRKVRHRQRHLRSLLKSFLRKLEGRQAPDHAGVSAGGASPQILAQKLEHWPHLSQENLHEFRKAVKELRYMLQLVPDQDSQRLNSYARVKDTVGDWHDWMELKRMAESTLDHIRDAALLREIRGILLEKFHAALSAANSLRRIGIDMPHAA
jgi:CHAD domain-containing protein